MSDLDHRLSAIFRAAFPELKEQVVRQASRDTVATWDSVAAVRLYSLVEEEFGEQFDLDAAAEWTSYEQVRNALVKASGG